LSGVVRAGRVSRRCSIRVRIGSSPAGRDQDLDAVRAADREFMTQLNHISTTRR
jgi:hypothetical protein